MIPHQELPCETNQVMSVDSRIERERQLILAAKQKGKGAIFKTFIRLSGPGWLQSGITVGGVTFSSSLYLGVLSGFTFLWLQPLYMILGIVMLAAIAYVTLSTGQRPLRVINERVNPVLGWSWLFATMAANLVWSMPQFTLATRAVQQNILPKLVGPDIIPDPWGRVIVVGCFLAVCLAATMLYGTSAGRQNIRGHHKNHCQLNRAVFLCRHPKAGFEGGRYGLGTGFARTNTQPAFSFQACRRFYASPSVSCRKLP